MKGKTLPFLATLFGLMVIALPAYGSGVLRRTLTKTATQKTIKLQSVTITYEAVLLEVQGGVIVVQRDASEATAKDLLQTGQASFPAPPGHPQPPLVVFEGKVLGRVNLCAWSSPDRLDLLKRLLGRRLVFEVRGDTWGLQTLISVKKISR